MRFLDGVEQHGVVDAQAGERHQMHHRRTMPPDLRRHAQRGFLLLIMGERKHHAPVAALHEALHRAAQLVLEQVFPGLAEAVEIPVAGDQDAVGARRSGLARVMRDHGADQLAVSLVVQRQLVAVEARELEELPRRAGHDEAMQGVVVLSFPALAAGRQHVLERQAVALETERPVVCRLQNGMDGAAAQDQRPQREAPAPWRWWTHRITVSRRGMRLFQRCGSRSNVGMPSGI